MPMHAHPTPHCTLQQHGTIASGTDATCARALPLARLHVVHHVGHAECSAAQGFTVKDARPPSSLPMHVYPLRCLQVHPTELK